MQLEAQLKKEIEDEETERQRRLRLSKISILPVENNIVKKEKVKNYA